LETLLNEIAVQYGFEILAVEIMPDHVHLFACPLARSQRPPVGWREPGRAAGQARVSAPPRFSPSEIVRLFKGITSRRLKQEFLVLRRQYWGAKATLWAEGY